MTEMTDEDYAKIQYKEINELGEQICNLFPGKNKIIVQMAVMHVCAFVCANWYESWKGAMSKEVFLKYINEMLESHINDILDQIGDKKNG